jgi:hypothetical protein
MILSAAAAAKTAGDITAAENKASAYNTTADIADQNAQIASDQGYSREEAVRRDDKQALSRQAAIFSQAGIDTSSGSALAVERTSAVSAEYDALNARYQGLSQATALRQQANNYRAAATGARRSEGMTAAADILQFAGRAYGAGMMPNFGGGGSGGFSYGGMPPTLGGMG